MKRGSKSRAYLIPPSTTPPPHNAYPQNLKVICQINICQDNKSKKYLLIPAYVLSMSIHMQIWSNPSSTSQDIDPKRNFIINQGS